MKMTIKLINLISSDYLCCCAVGLRSWGMDECKNLSPAAIGQIQAYDTTVLLPILYLVAFVVGLPSNLVALWVLLFRTKKQPSTILLINLTTCDCWWCCPSASPQRLPTTIGNNWTLGEPLCRLVIAVFYGNTYGSVLSLALISFDRYLALVHPIGGRALRSYRFSVYMCIAAWAVVVAAMAPLLATQLTYRPTNLNITTCHDVLPLDKQDSFFLPYFASLFTICYLLPLLVVVFCYRCILHTLVKSGRRYNHAVRVTVLTIVVFLVCLLPSNVLLLSNMVSADKTSEDNLYVPYMVMLALSTFNSCLDPFIFYYVSEDSREKAQQMLFYRKPKLHATSSKQDTGSTSGSSQSKVRLLSTSGQVIVIPEATTLKGNMA
ncbi:proteinase-activated receptor 4-like [Clupea harengus]|uniref:Proteinase-activated receptor 4-like n=1 Tax=Clupea harengus TaxID=7950 RepID=A0A6P3W2E9_CLUHA|nr:proteinase-activated receptor 4-like [Clupea harengus]